MVMTIKLTVLMSTHNITPNRMALMPTFLMTSTDRSVPIRKRVMAKPVLATSRIFSTSSGGNGKNVLAIIASVKNRMNQGLYTLSVFCLKNRDVTMATGIIHKARVSLTVVATFRASSP